MGIRNESAKGSNLPYYLTTGHHDGRVEIVHKESLKTVRVFKGPSAKEAALEFLQGQSCKTKSTKQRLYYFLAPTSLTGLALNFLGGLIVCCAGFVTLVSLASFVDAKMVSLEQDPLRYFVNMMFVYYSVPTVISLLSIALLVFAFGQLLHHLKGIRQVLLISGESKPTQEPVDDLEQQIQMVDVKQDSRYMPK